METFSTGSLEDTKLVDFGAVPVDTITEKYLTVQNNSTCPLVYRVSSMYVLENIDRVFHVHMPSCTVTPRQNISLKIVFKPHNANQTYTDYYVVDDTEGNGFKITVVGKCYGPLVSINRKKLEFSVVKNVNEKRVEIIHITNNSAVDTTYQWLLPPDGQGHFQISTGNCGLIKAYESIRTSIMFTGSVLGIYTAELVCLVLNQEPLLINTIATVVLQNALFTKIKKELLPKPRSETTRTGHLMENSLNNLPYIPMASVVDTYLNFGTGSVTDITKNISKTLYVTNHGNDVGHIQWMTDPDNVFLVDPVGCIIPPQESRMFTVRFRPNIDNEVYGYLITGDYQQKVQDDENTRLQHMWFRVPCIGNTCSLCTNKDTSWDCPTEIILPPTVPCRVTFKNFMLSNKLDIPMYFYFEPPSETNFVVMPMCGLVQSRGWEIITVAMEPKMVGHFCEGWDLIINNVEKVRISLLGTAEVSKLELLSHGYYPSTDALYEFPPTITGCTNFASAYFHNLTRMDIHIRVLSYVTWLGADHCGSFVVPARQIVKLNWWFFPKEPNKVYETIITLTCVCLIEGRPVGETKELFVHITGFSEFPDLKVLANRNNLHDLVVDESTSLSLTLYNFGSCFFTSKLYPVVTGLGDSCDNDRLEIYAAVNTLEPSKHCTVNFTITPGGAGSRQICIKFTVLFHNEFNELEEIQPVTKTICIIWYDGVYPTLKVKRIISDKGPVILSNHCAWSLSNIEELNKAFVECRPNKTLTANIYAPDLCTHLKTPVIIILVLGVVHRVPASWSLRREKLCDCAMVEVKVGISTYEMRHNCVHRSMVELDLLSGITTAEKPDLLKLRVKYLNAGHNVLRYVMTLSHQRTINININLLAYVDSKGVLSPLRRILGSRQYLAVLDCGRVPINNLDPVVRIVWLYNPTQVYTTWRLLKGNKLRPETAIKCLLYFAEIPPMGRLALPFAFHPTEMIDYESTFSCSFGYDIVEMLVKGQGGLPNSMEVRIDVPKYVERVIREANRTNAVYLSKEHLTIPMMPTHSLYREIIGISNDTDHTIRYIWTTERIPNIINMVMTPGWGVLQPKSSEWVTLTIYSLQLPATFTTVVSCELLDLTARKEFQQNESLKRTKMRKCADEFIITEEGTFHLDINTCPPYVLRLEIPKPFYLALSVAVDSKGQRDGCARLHLRQMQAQAPPYELLCNVIKDNKKDGRASQANNLQPSEIVRTIDGILWDVLHSKTFRYQLEYLSKEEIPTYEQLMDVVQAENPTHFSQRVTSGICDAIVNKAVYGAYELSTMNDNNGFLEV